jgi:hypothetical protein
MMPVAEGMLLGTWRPRSARWCAGRMVSYST